MMKCIKKIDLTLRSGSATSKSPTCKHFESMLFIRDNVANKETQSNLILTDAKESSLEQTNTACCLQSPPVSPALSSISSSSATTSGKRRRTDDIRSALERSKQRREQLDEMLEKALVKDDQEKDDADMLFCKSIAPLLRGLDCKQNMMAKIEIQQVLMKHAFGSEEH